MMLFGLKRMEDLAEEFSRYSYRPIIVQLHGKRFRVNHKKVLRLMREWGLLCKPRWRGVRTTDNRHGYPLYPNLLPEGPVMAPNRVWVGDITDILILVDSYTYPRFWTFFPGKPLDMAYPGISPSRSV
jgi:transposase InsO family protein